MLKKIKAYVEKYHMLAPGDVVVAGVSGGADSVCLLFVLLELQKEIPFTLTVVHVNHGIRPEAGEDAAYVQKLCKEQGVTYCLYETDIRKLAKEQGTSEEEAGRNFRYRCFQEVLGQNGGKPGKIAVAHNLNDRAETMLFNLFRGSGLSGMTGIRPVREDIIRPLLGIDRSEIEDYLESRDIPYCIDSSNLEDDYTRNRIRHHILTCAAEINPQASAHMAGTADAVWEAEEYIGKQAKAVADQCVSRMLGQIEIDRQKLLKQEPLIQKRIFLFALEQVIPGRKDITTAHIKGLMDIAWGEGNREIHLPYGLCGMRRYEKIIIKAASDDEKNSEVFTVADSGSLFIPNMGILKVRVFPYQKSERIPQKTYTKWFDYDKITTSAVFRTRQQDDYLIINQAGNRKTLKEYMINEKIPREDREQMYVLADGSHIIWIPGYRISEYYKVTEQTRVILELKIEGENTNE